MYSLRIVAVALKEEERRGETACKSISDKIFYRSGRGRVVFLFYHTL